MSICNFISTVTKYDYNDCNVKISNQSGKIYIVYIIQDVLYVYDVIIETY